MHTMTAASHWGTLPVLLHAALLLLAARALAPAGAQRAANAGGAAADGACSVCCAPPCPAPCSTAPRRIETPCSLLQCMVQFLLCWSSKRSCPAGSTLWFQLTAPS